MSHLFRPVGPHSTRVYWKRRIVVLAVLVVLVGAVIGIGTALAKKGTPAPGPTPPAATGKDKDSAKSPQCGKADIDLTLTADAQTYAAGTNPRFSIELRNAGDRPCLVDVNATTRVLQVVSGKDDVFSSGHCAEGTPRLLLLKAAETDATTITWERMRSDKTCPAKPAVAKAGTYKASVTLAGATSKEVTFVLK